MITQERMAVKPSVPASALAGTEGHPYTTLGGYLKGNCIGGCEGDLLCWSQSIAYAT